MTHTPIRRSHVESMSTTALTVQVLLASIVLLAVGVFYFVQWARGEEVKRPARPLSPPSKTKAASTLTREEHMPAAIKTLGVIGLVIAGAFFLATGYQVDHLNLFGQECRPTTRDWVYRCTHPEWIAIGAGL